MVVAKNKHTTKELAKQKKGQRMNADQLHANRINLIYKASKSISKDKREEFIKLALKLAYLDGEIDVLEKYFKKEKK